MAHEFSLGCNGRGAQGIPGRKVPVDEQFRLVKETGLFDHFDRMPQPGEEAEYVRAAQKHELPIRTGLWSYAAGRDEARLERNLRLCREAGAECHDIMLLARHGEGRPVSDDEVRDFYLHAYDLAGRIGIEIGFEVHIYMWSEDFRRVNRVADAVRARGIPFNFVLDHSHVLLKVDNPEEQDVSGIRADVESGRLVIDPYQPGNVLDDWIARDMTVWLQVRPVSPAGPKNPGELKEEGHWGRACQYPFRRPRPGEWFHPWHAYRVEPCLEVVRRVLRRHRDNPESRLRWVTTDMIDMADYGGGVGYSLIEQNAAIAAWIRRTWSEIRDEEGPWGSYHAHVYYDPGTTRAAAESLRRRIDESFPVQIGRWHDEEVGPHSRSMFQVAFTRDQFAGFVPWLMQQRGGLSVLVHPNSGRPRDDHLHNALWLGPPLALKAEALPVEETPGERSPIVPNTAAHRRRAGAAV